MSYKAFQNPAYKFINPNKDAPATGSEIDINKRAREFKDVSLAFSPHPVTKDLTIVRNERAINNSIKNLIMYMFGEVPFQEDIGSNVRGYMFDTVNPATAQFIEQEIQRVIEDYEPRAIIEGEENQFPWDLGEVKSGYSAQADDNYSRNAGYATVNQFLRETNQSLGVYVQINEEQNAFEVSVFYNIVGYDQVFSVEHILYPTRV